ncbi:equilibrative nucleobase transporter 1-like isoform X2 [Convolutriloba macropyga]|uniref:equilibrative nucleobase transporter 1-like isoform X2 n=1 Tax=Convolutriloba macropyga TaxID=536237 RepID=UPI003F52344C
MKSEGRLKYQKELNVVTFVLALFECLCFAGIIFGWFSIRPVLEQEGFFGAQTKSQVQVSELISGAANNETKNSSLEQVSAPECGEENNEDSSKGGGGGISDSDAMFNLVFTLASSAVNYSSLFTGFLLDKFGTMVSKILASLLFSSGLFILAFATPDSSWLLFLSFSFLLPVGGYWHFISNFQIGNLFGKWQGTVVTIFSGSFDSSSFVFLLFAELYGFGFSLRTIFLVYGCASMYLLINTMLFLPRSYIPFPLPENWTKNYKFGQESPLGNAANDQSVHQKDEELLKDSSEPVKEEFGTPEGETEKEHDRSSIMVVSDEENNLKEVEIDMKENENSDKKVAGDKDEFDAVAKTKKLSDDADNVELKENKDEQDSPQPLQKECSFLWDCVFTLKFCCHVVFVSVNQLKIYIFLSVVLTFLETFDLSKDECNSSKVESDPLGDFALPLFITCLLGTICSGTLLVPSATVQYASFFLQVILRAFNYGLAFSFIACNFPPQHIGKLIGLLMTIAATFSLLQYPIIQSVDSCKPDFTQVHLLLFGLGALPFIHPLTAWYQSKKNRDRASPKLQDDYVLTEMKKPDRTSVA